MLGPRFRMFPDEKVVNTVPDLNRKQPLRLGNQFHMLKGEGNVRTRIIQMLIWDYRDTERPIYFHRDDTMLLGVEMRLHALLVFRRHPNDGLGITDNIGYVGRGKVGMIAPSFNDPLHAAHMAAALRES